MGKLFIVPTPIGNLKDMTFRAVEVLNTVDLIIAEDTRTSGKLLQHYEIKKPMQSYHKFNEHHQSQRYVEQMLQGQDIALISDAGTPAISDPGFLLVRDCLEAQVEVECLPGATAFVPALVNSGFPNDRFVFEGFLPVKKGRQKRLKALEEETKTMIFYESPYRLTKTLGQFIDIFGEERMVSVSRELTKLHEENIRLPLKDLLQHFENKIVKGEIVIIVSGKQ